MVQSQSTATLEQLFHLGLRHQRAGDLASAARLFDEVLAREPKHWGALQLLGVAAYQQGQYEAALKLLDQSIAIEPNQASTHGNLGLVLDAVNRFDDAIASHQRALALRPNDLNLYHNLGNSLHRAGRASEAVLAYRRALALRPSAGGVLSEIGGALNSLCEAHNEQHGKLSNLGGAFNNLGNAYKDQGDVENCIAAYRQATVVQPKDARLYSNLLLALHYHPELDPMVIADEHRRWSEIHAGPAAGKRSTDDQTTLPLHSNTVDPDRRLRIGYVSADFHQHPVARFLLPLITNHDPAAVEIFAYSQVNAPDALTEQFRASTAVWRDIARLSDAAAAEMIRRDRIDILVDLAGHTAGNRLLVFAHKPAPVQVTYLGYPGSTGLDAIDYRLTDPLADPTGQTEHLHSEKLLRIEPCAWCFQPAAEVPLPRRESGPITFGSFNTFAKLNASTLRIWSKILHGVPGSHLLLKSDGLRHAGSRQSVLERLRQLGIESDRVTLRGHEHAYTDHLALYGRVDIALDTFPYHGTTTTCEALWMGSPVVTMAGTTHVSRVGVSLLSVVGLSDLIATTPEAYIQIALGLANDRQRLSALHTTLRRRVEQSPLMNAKAFACKIEAAYRQMWQTWCESR